MPRPHSVEPARFAVKTRTYNIKVVCHHWRPVPGRISSLALHLFVADGRRTTGEWVVVVKCNISINICDGRLCVVSGVFIAATLAHCLRWYRRSLRPQDAHTERPRRRKMLSDILMSLHWETSNRKLCETTFRNASEERGSQHKTLKTSLVSFSLSSIMLNDVVTFHYKRAVLV